MLGIENISIKKKLMVLVMLAVVTAMSLSSTAFVINYARSINEDMIRQISVLADVLGSNTTAALTFDDARTAAELLSSLRVQPMITAAVLFEKNGSIFATYPADAAPKDLTEPSQPGYEYIGSSLQITAPIIQNGERIGTICIRGNTDVIRQQLIGYAAIVGVVMLVSLTAAYLLASRLQGVISKPILALAAYGPTDFSKQRLFHPRRQDRQRRVGNSLRRVQSDARTSRIQQAGIAGSSRQA